MRQTGCYRGEARPAADLRPDLGLALDRQRAVGVVPPARVCHLVPACCSGLACCLTVSVPAPQAEALPVLARLAWEPVPVREPGGRPASQPVRLVLLGLAPAKGHSPPLA